MLEQPLSSRPVTPSLVPFFFFFPIEKEPKSHGNSVKWVVSRTTKKPKSLDAMIRARRRVLPQVPLRVALSNIPIDAIKRLPCA
jgi:hypothetical protein